MISLMHCSIVLDEEDTPKSFELQSVENVRLCKCDLDRFLLPFSLLDFFVPIIVSFIDGRNVLCVVKISLISCLQTWVPGF